MIERHTRLDSGVLFGLIGKRTYSWKQYAQSVGLVALATLLGFPLSLFVEPTNLVMVYLLAVVIAALSLGRRPAILASILSVLAFDFVFVHPFYTLAVSDVEYLLTFTALLMVGLVISTLAAQAREQTRAAQDRQIQTAVLYELSRDLATAVELKQICQVVVSHLEHLFGGKAIILLSRAETVEPFVWSDNFTPDKNEQAVALWAFQHGQPAGHGTDRLAGAAAIYLPLKTARNKLGVLGISPAASIRQLSPEQRLMLGAFANQTAQAIERVHLAEEAAQAQLLRETEKLQTTLLNSISHDLRTPLASITGALSSLRDDAAFLDETDRTDLVNNAWEQAERLNQLLGNLLEMTRLEAGALKVRLELCDVQDLIGVALAQLGHRLDGRPVDVEVPDDLPLAPMDFVLMVQVLVNLLDNAVKFSPPHQPITIEAHLIGDQLLIEVLDRGLGVPEQELGRIFNKFYQAHQPHRTGGSGLGLSISKGIAEAHAGRIWAERRPEGGMIFTIALPLSNREILKTEISP